MNNLTKPQIPFCSLEYETRIARLTLKEYEIFKKLLMGVKPKYIIIDNKQNNDSNKMINKIYKKLEVNSQVELMAKYSMNYYYEMEGIFNSEKC
ncbi:MAG: hypothetical protein Q4G04_06570 [bacterium]|nr:hypothetical protein [bacterium]